jgi:hypothetical protein
MKKVIIFLMIAAIFFTIPACAPAKVWDTDKMGGIEPPAGTLTSVTRVSGGLKYLYSDVMYNDATDFIYRLSTGEFSQNIISNAVGNELSYYGENIEGKSFKVIYNIDSKTCTITYLN